MAGRKPGTPKTGGRRKGSVNKVGADLRALAQEYTEEAVAALVKGLRDPDNYVNAAKILLAYGHGAPRAAVDVTVKPVYVIGDRPLSADEWAAKYAEPSGAAKPAIAARMVPPRRPAKRTR